MTPPRPDLWYPIARLLAALRTLQRAAAGRKADRYLFQLIEAPGRPSRAGPSQDPADLQWAILMEAAMRLAEVLANPAPHARRLARRLGSLTAPGLRDLPVPWHITRQIPPWLDVLICQLDAAARPEAWAGLDTS